MNYGAMPTALAEYLLRLDRTLWLVPRDRRDALLRQVGDHLGEDLYRTGLEGMMGFHWLVREHGTPEAMGRRFRREERRDLLLRCAGSLLPVVATLMWSLFLGEVRGIDHRDPGYLSFVTDFPTLVAVLTGIRALSRRMPDGERLLIMVLGGLVSGLVYCHFACEGSGFGSLEHGLYGAFFGMVLHRHTQLPSLPRGMMDVGFFFLLMQCTFMGREYTLAPMSLGCLLYHVFNGFGMTLIIWGAARFYGFVRRLDQVLAPSL